jgi:5'-nucleotidase
LLLLLTNDDGIYAPGLHALYRALRDRHRIVVVAPEHEVSAVGHGITLNTPLRVRDARRKREDFRPFGERDPCRLRQDSRFRS